MLRQDLKRGLTSWQFWVGISVFVAAMLLMLRECLAGINIATPMNAFDGIFFQNVVYILPIISVLPLGTVFYDEWNSQNYRLFLPRCGWKQYALKRIASTGILGALIVGIPSALLIGFCYVVFPEDFSGAANSIFKNLTIENYPKYALWFPGGSVELMAATPERLANAERIYAVARIASLLVFGACWAQIGLAVSAWIDNWVFILVVPLGVFMAGTFVGSWFYMPLVNTWSMATFGFGDYPLWVSYVIPLVWASIFIVFFVGGLRRRRAHE